MKDNENSGTSLLTYEEAGKRLQVSDRTVRNLVDDGVLPVVRFRGSVRFDPEDLEDLIQQGKKVPARRRKRKKKNNGKHQ